MKVRDVMMRTAARCRPDTNLGAAVELMWTRNCGILPSFPRLRGSFCAGPTLKKA